MDSNKKEITFVAGVHGVGKTTFCEAFAPRISAFSISASTLIKRHKQLNHGKSVENIKANQNILVDQLLQLNIKEKNILLDGHFCLLNTDLEIEVVPMETFKSILPVRIIVLKCDPQIIYNRLVNRDKSTEFIVSLIDRMQSTEISRAIDVARELKIPIKEFDTSSEYTEQTIKEFFMDF